MLCVHEDRTRRVASLPDNQLIKFSSHLSSLVNCEFGSHQSSSRLSNGCNSMGGGGEVKRDSIPLSPEMMS